MMGQRPYSHTVYSCNSPWAWHAPGWSAFRECQHQPHGQEPSAAQGSTKWNRSCNLSKTASAIQGKLCILSCKLPSFISCCESGSESVRKITSLLFRGTDLQFTSDIIMFASLCWSRILSDSQQKQRILNHANLPHTSRIKVGSCCTVPRLSAVHCLSQ